MLQIGRRKISVAAERDLEGGKLIHHRCSPVPQRQIEKERKKISLPFSSPPLPIFWSRNFFSPLTVFFSPTLSIAPVPAASIKKEKEARRCRRNRERKKITPPLDRRGRRSQPLRYAGSRSVEEDHEKKFSRPILLLMFSSGF
ncbi:hypothetical protein KSP40_PGU014209 [Platanthera guangdongensis]|uniref:Uncharacterized protein n=1 Tax=Platanthera guangdongensis TaxID=2320717 RepID=A0ABR2MJL4_9ASPA